MDEQEIGHSKWFLSIFGSVTVTNGTILIRKYLKISIIFFKTLIEFLIKLWNELRFYPSGSMMGEKRTWNICTFYSRGKRNVELLDCLKRSAEQPVVVVKVLSTIYQAENLKDKQFHFELFFSNSPQFLL